MGVLHWNVEAIRLLWEHALCAADWREPHSPHGREPGLLLTATCLRVFSGRGGRLAVTFLPGVRSIGVRRNR